MKVTEKFMGDIFQINAGDIIVLKSRKGLLEINIKNRLFESTANILAKTEHIVKAIYKNVYRNAVETFEHNEDLIDTFYPQEIAYVIKDIKGVCDLPATEDLFDQLKAGDRVLLKNKKQCVKEFNINVTSLIWDKGMVLYTDHEVKIHDKGIINTFWIKSYLEGYNNYILYLWPRKAIERITFIAK